MYKGPYTSNQSSIGLSLVGQLSTIATMHGTWLLWVALIYCIDLCPTTIGCVRLHRRWQVASAGWMDMSPLIPNRAGVNGSFPLTEAQFDLWVQKYADLMTRTGLVIFSKGVVLLLSVWPAGSEFWYRLDDSNGLGTNVRLGTKEFLFYFITCQLQLLQFLSTLVLQVNLDFTYLTLKHPMWMKMLTLCLPGRLWRRRTSQTLSWCGRAMIGYGSDLCNAQVGEYEWPTFRDLRFDCESFYLTWWIAWQHTNTDTCKGYSWIESHDPLRLQWYPCCTLDSEFPKRILKLRICKRLCGRGTFQDREF